MTQQLRPVKIIDSAALRWYACYTRSRTEKAAQIRLLQEEVECYLPLQRTKRRWSDRYKWVDEPLIKSYIFVRVNVADFSKVLRIEGMVRFITFEGKAVPIPDSQIEAIRLLLGNNLDLEVTSERLAPGQAVEVQAGPLLGIRGELVEYRGNKKVLVRLGEIGQGILVTIGPEFLARI